MHFDTTWNIDSVLTHLTSSLWLIGMELYFEVPIGLKETLRIRQAKVISMLARLQICFFGFFFLIDRLKIQQYFLFRINISIKNKSLSIFQIQHKHFCVS